MKLPSHQFKDYTLISEQIDIWQLPLTTVPSEAEEILDKLEIERANRFYFTHHQRRFQAAHAYTRLILSRYLDHSPAKLIFKFNKYGKPYLHTFSEIYFNLSHSRDLALLAIGYKEPLGIDLEYFSSRPYLGIANNLFSSTEVQALTNLPPYLQTFGFFHIWAQKESFIKSCWLGLSYPTQDFSVSILPIENQLVYDKVNQKNWAITSFMPQFACCAAICYAPAITSIRFINLTTIL